MKLRISENNILQEDIAAVKKYYPNIPDDTFMQLISLDPTYRDGSNSVGKYGKWILNLYKKGTISEEDFSEITPLLTQFTTYKNRVANKDLNSYKTLDDLSNTLAHVVDDDSMLSDRQKLRFRKNVKAGRISTSAEDDYDVVFDDGMYIVYVPNTHEASMKLGKGTEWCTAHENPDWYNKYTKNGGKLYIVKNKQTGERWQYSDSSNDFLDENDEEFNWFDLLSSDDCLYSFMNKLNPSIFKRYTEDDFNYVYRGNLVYGMLRNIIKNITIPEYVGAINTPFAFRGFIGVKDIFIPNTVYVIEQGAFMQCTNLESVDFEYDSRLKKLSNSLFMECTALKEINIPDTVTIIYVGAF